MTDEPTYRALDRLTGEDAPKIKGKTPFWRPRKVPVWDQVRLPAWSWEREECTEIPRITLDVNAAYLAACSSATFAHGALEHTGRDLPIKAPGMYLVDTHTWPDPAIVSPLGQQPFRDGRVWVAHPTALLLDKLSQDGKWPQVTVYDSYTASTSCRLRQWTDGIKKDRAAALLAKREGSAQGEADYEAVKLGYSQAIQLMRGPAEGAKTKASIVRPDWYQTVHAQHAASMWRKGWNAKLAGHGPVAMGSVDTLTWLIPDLEELQMREVPVVRIDPTGALIGALCAQEDK